MGRKPYDDSFKFHHQDRIFFTFLNVEKSILNDKTVYYAIVSLSLNEKINRILKKVETNNVMLQTVFLCVISAHVYPIYFTALC